MDIRFRGYGVILARRVIPATYSHSRGSGNDAIDMAVVDAPTVIPAT